MFCVEVVNIAFEGTRSDMPTINDFTCKKKKNE